MINIATPFVYAYEKESGRKKYGNNLICFGPDRILLC